MDGVTGARPFQEGRVRAAMHKAWSLESAVQWQPDNPALGQCNVTAAVAQDLFSGEILRTRLDGVWHYYNRIDGVRHDLTDSQFTAPRALFPAPEPYADAPSDRATALATIPDREVRALRSALLAALSEG